MRSDLAGAPAIAATPDLTTVLRGSPAPAATPDGGGVQGAADATPAPDFADALAAVLPAPSDSVRQPGMPGGLAPGSPTKANGPVVPIPEPASGALSLAEPANGPDIAPAIAPAPAGAPIAPHEPADPAAAVSEPAPDAPDRAEETVATAATIAPAGPLVPVSTAAPTPAPSEPGTKSAPSAAAREGPGAPAKAVPVVVDRSPGEDRADVESAGLPKLPDRASTRRKPAALPADSLPTAPASIKAEASSRPADRPAAPQQLPLAQSPAAPTPPPAAGAAPPAPAPIDARSPHFPQALAVEVAHRARAGDHAFTIRLDPADMGPIRIELSFAADGSVAGVIQCDAKSTQDLLRGHLDQFARAMQDQGMRADSGAFRLGTDSGGSSGGQQQHGRRQPKPDWSAVPGGGGDTADRGRIATVAGRVNLIA